MSRVNAKDSPHGRGCTQLGRALFELNIDIFCANSSKTKERVNRKNGTLQDRLLKVLRLRGIDTPTAANTNAPSFIAQFYARFAKVLRSDFDAHRPVRGAEDLTWIFLRAGNGRKLQNVALAYDEVDYLLQCGVAHRS